MSSLIVLNRHAVVLAVAADTGQISTGQSPGAGQAGRYGRRDRRRRRNEHADTILDFSYSEPAALLVRGRPTFSEYPWASIVNQFRAHCGRPATVSGLAKEFAAWLEGAAELDRAAIARAWEDTLYGFLIDDWGPSPPGSPMTAEDPRLESVLAAHTAVFDQVIARLQGSGDAVGLQGFAGQMRRWLAARLLRQPWVTLTVAGYDVDAPSPSVVRIAMSGPVGGRLQIDVGPARASEPSTGALIIGSGPQVPAQDVGVDTLLSDVLETLAPLRERLGDDGQQVLRQTLLQVHDRIRHAGSIWQRAAGEHSAGSLGVRRGLADKSPSALADAARALVEHARLGQSLIEGAPSGEPGVQLAVVSRDGGYQGPGAGREVSQRQPRWVRSGAFQS